MRDAAYYREKAAQFRDIANECDKRTAAILADLAEDYEAEARRLERDAEPPMPVPE